MKIKYALTIGLGIAGIVLIIIGIINITQILQNNQLL